MRQYAAGPGHQSPCSNPLFAAALSRGTFIQPKLEVGAVDDPAELEADRIADEVLRAPEPVAAPIAPVGTSLWRKCACWVKEVAQRSAFPSATGFAAPSASEAVSGLGGGSALPRAERAFFEPRLGIDLSAVRIHTGASADSASRALRARAFTLGSDIAFANGEYRPGSAAGRRLLAHELVHVAQQAKGDAPHLVRRRPRHRRHGGGSARGSATPQICGRDSRVEPGNFITRVVVDLSANELTIEWNVTAGMPSLKIGPHRVSPGAGMCCLNCNDTATSTRPDTACTPKGVFTVDHTACHLHSHPSARNPVYFQRSDIAIHSGNTRAPPRSHGCVRTATSVSELIHDNVRSDTTIAVSGNWAGRYCYRRMSDEDPVSRTHACHGTGVRTPHPGRRAEAEGAGENGIAGAPWPRTGQDVAASPVVTGDGTRGADGPGPGNEPADDLYIPPPGDVADASAGAEVEGSGAKAG